MEKLKALCDENRLKILKMLADRELCACDFIENLDLTQPTVSHHLKVLVESGIIDCEKRGKWSFYKTNCTELKKFINELDRLSSVRQEDIKLCKTDCDGHRGSHCSNQTH